MRQRYLLMPLIYPNCFILFVLGQFFGLKFESVIFPLF